MLRPHSTPSILLATLVALATIGPVAPAHARVAIPPPPGLVPFDEVRLPSGGFVRGQLQEFVPGGHVVLRKSDGTLQRFEWSEIYSVVKADGSVVKHDDVSAPTPTPTPEIAETDPPDPVEALEPEPDPLEDGSDEADEADDLDFAEESESEEDLGIDEELGLELDLDDAVDEEPLPGEPTIRIDVDRDGPAVSLHNLGDAGQELCTAPCDRAIARQPGAFFVSSDGTRLGKQFRLAGDAPSYRVDVKRDSPVRKWSGVALMPAALIIGIGIGIIPALHNMPRTKIAGYAVGGTLIGLAGIGGGVTLLMFSRSKVKVLPGSGLARRSTPRTRKGRS